MICDERLNGEGPESGSTLRVLYGFAPVRPGEFQSFLLTRSPAGATTRAVSVNRYWMSRDRVEEEIETAILRQLVIA